MAETIVVVGKWIEKRARVIERCPSYYAADHEALVTRPGEYEARIAYVGGYIVPMPYWLLVKVAADRVAGRLYSGFAGVNFASTELPKGPATYCVQLSATNLRVLVDAGELALDEVHSWMAEVEYPWQHADAPKAWADVR